MYTKNEWVELGQYFQSGDHKIWYVDKGESPEILLILHGYPTSSYDYHHILDLIPKNFRVILPDHLGFGLSDKPTRFSYSLVDQAQMICDLLDYLKIKSLHLIAHDYGTSIATELIARFNAQRTNFEINSMVLSNGSIHIELSQLRLIQKILLHKVFGPMAAKFISFKTFQKNMKNIFYDPSKISIEDLKHMWQFIEFNNGRKVIHQITQYIKERKEKWDRWVGGLKVTEVPTLILWAKNDPVTVSAIADLLHEEIKDSTLIWIDHCGHFPMLEKPDEWIRSVRQFIETKLTM